MNQVVTVDQTTGEVLPTAPAVYQGPRIGAVTSMFNDPVKFEFAQRVGNMFAQSQLVPAHMRGKVADCMIALNIADRLGEDPLTVMQSIVIVNGSPGWKATYMIARANLSGRLRGPIRWKHEGEPGKNDYVCTAFADLADPSIPDAERRIEAEVSWLMADGEGWLRNAKYKSMPKVMMQYRAASFLVRMYLPDIMLGIQVAEELETERDASGTYQVLGADGRPPAGDRAAIRAKLTAPKVEAPKDEAAPQEAASSETVSEGAQDSAAPAAKPTRTRKPKEPADAKPQSASEAQRNVGAGANQSPDPAAGAVAAEPDPGKAEADEGAEAPPEQAAPATTVTTPEETEEFLREQYESADDIETFMDVLTRTEGDFQDLVARNRGLAEVIADLRMERAEDLILSMFAAATTEAELAQAAKRADPALKWLANLLQVGPRDRLAAAYRQKQKAFRTIAVSQESDDDGLLETHSPSQGEPGYRAPEAGISMTWREIGREYARTSTAARPFLKPDALKALETSDYPAFEVALEEWKTGFMEVRNGLA